MQRNVADECIFHTLTFRCSLALFLERFINAVKDLYSAATS